MNVTIQSLHSYPLKSAGGVPLASAEMGITGLPSDRRWMLVDDEGRFVSQRRVSEMARLSVAMELEGMTVRHPDQEPLFIGTDAVVGDVFEANMHRADEHLKVCSAGATAADWFTECFRETGIGGLRLVRLIDQFARRIPDRPEEVRQRMFLSDGYPFLIASDASLELLNQQLGSTTNGQLEMNRFRPNIVIGGPGPWMEMKTGLVLEDETGAIRLRLVKPCQRCTIPQVNPNTGQRDVPSDLHRLLKQLDHHRDVPINCFGQNAILEAGAGRTLSVGQSLRLVDG